MKRDLNLFIHDILESIEKIENFMRGIPKKDFLKNEEKQSAVIREIEVVGEAVKNLPESFRKKFPEISWNKIAGMRDIVIHSYFKVDLDAVWNVVQEDLPDLKNKIEKILKEN
ncbi:MAG: DUF86 domain-containing protein [Nanoarchaeota archaeon]